ncbi:peptidase [Neptunitalea chrysea]|uniref:Aminopeptidase N n=1 Tax=Neptunitalea chrysea TaxID=1647581 RepID=A0A9W6EUD6_9FLAO|nr:peptidase [Neptunitalea chrysea]
MAQNPDVDIQQYEFHLSVTDTNNEIKGKAVIDFDFVNTTDVLQLDFVAVDAKGKGMKVDSVVQEHNKLKFAQDKETLSIYTSSDAQVAVYYHGIPKDGLIISKNIYGNRTFFGDNWPNRAHHWLPVIDHPTDKAKVSFYVTVPKKYEVIATGTLQEIFESGSTKKYLYKSPVELSTKVMVIGVAQFAVEDLGTVANVPLTSWVYPENEKAGFYDYAIAEPILNFFTQHISEFPFTKLANVQSTTRYGGMENAGNIFYSEKSVDGKRSYEFIIAHEIAHQWFGDSASEIDWPQLWLSEGFATYFTNLYAEYAYGKEKLDERLQKERAEVIAFSKYAKTPIIDSSRTELIELLNPNSYQKGGWVLHMLRRKVGDAIFWKAIKKYYQTYAYSNATSHDLQAVFEEVSGTDLELFFKQWLTQYGEPKLKLDYTYKNKKATITIHQLQQSNFEFPLQLRITYANKDAEVIEVQVTKKEQVFEVEVPETPTTIVLDPNTNLLFEKG